jgi:general secretion pathway protein G
VVILAIIGALVVPQFSNAARTSRENTLREDLRFMRSQIQVYQAQHGGTAPGFPGGSKSSGPTEAAFVAQMTQPTSSFGNVGTVLDATHNLGPYLRRMPDNPVNDLSTVRVIGSGAFPTEPADTHGWVYQPSTMKFAADCAGVDDDGRRYFDY